MKAEKGKIIAVWGSPASGKSTFAVKLATAIYDNFESTVIVLFMASIIYLANQQLYKGSQKNIKNFLVTGVE